MVPSLVLLWVQEVGELRDSEAILRKQLDHEVAVASGVGRLQCSQQNLQKIGSGKKGEGKRGGMEEEGGGKNRRRERMEGGGARR